MSNLILNKTICDAVFEGGGMRGIGFVGAALKFEQQGYKFRRLAGSSAGAIVAALLAAGYSAQEIYDQMKEVDFAMFKQSNALNNIGPIGMFINANKSFGIYETDYFENWIEQKLAAKNIYTFNDIGDKLKLTASDVTDGRLLVLPDDLAKFGINPRTFKISTAIRMSMGIPVFYKPYELVDVDGHIHYVVDGGLLSNYPVWILDSGNDALDVPVIGFRFVHRFGSEKSKKTNLLTYMKHIISTIIESHDDECHTIIRGDLQRTVYIDTRVGDTNVGITDFNLPSERIEGLFTNGYTAATAFLAEWDFDRWKQQFRS